jgi:hypothetical protein
MEWPAGPFLSAYNDNHLDATVAPFEDSLVGTPLLRLVCPFGETVIGSSCQSARSTDHHQITSIPAILCTVPFLRPFAGTSSVKRAS